ncbi:hypothetical protein VCHA37P200_10004 [Vibrio chagasii]|nr:hypothetical protein VCHA27O13_200110 [Vibrio chagasii]CAH6802063.1 hypothetical protein VCHA34P112_120004 [Vibrio chagasii]CAH6908834.1 hypothetical protein VCHA54P489_120005 [Vibrio chagasii]CAH6912533.1 hypothetical protein VCHA49P380_110004 [Vibrio chagasii]CAH6935017.1 hypothetical protein VCHA37P202_100161 [Vibrio chagasii]
MVVTSLGSIQKSCSLKTLLKAPWQSGYAADCKSVDLGSTPGGASTFKVERPADMLAFLLSEIPFLHAFLISYAVHSLNFTSG